MKISKKDLKLLLYVGGILCLLLVYLWVFKPAMASHNAIKTENEQLEAELVSMQEHAQKQEEYQEQISIMKAEIAEVTKVFPADVREENMILYADALEEESDMRIADISMGPVNQLYGFENGNQLMSTQTVYTFTASYEDLKREIRTIKNADEKKNVEQIILSFDSASGKLVGTMNVNFFFMTGTEKEYENPEIKGIYYGTDNIFGTVTSAGESEIEDEEEKEDTQ